MTTTELQSLILWSGVLVGHRSGLNQLYNIHGTCRCFVWVYMYIYICFEYMSLYVHLIILSQNWQRALNWLLFNIIQMFTSFCFCFSTFDACVYLVTTANTRWFSGHSKACHMHLALPSVTMCANRRIVGKTWKALPTKGSDVLMEITGSPHSPNGQKCDGTSEKLNALRKSLQSL